MDNRASLAELKAELSARIAAQQGSEPSFARFFAAAAAGIPDEDLVTTRVSRLEAQFRAAYARLGKRAPDVHDVSFIAPENEGEPEIIEVFTTDRPFLGDSLLAAIRALGGEVTLFTSAVLDYDP